MNASMKNGKVVHLKMLGVTSPSEAQTIETVLLHIDGVQGVSVNLLEEQLQRQSVIIVPSCLIWVSLSERLS